MKLIWRKIGDHNTRQYEWTRIANGYGQGSENTAWCLRHLAQWLEADNYEVTSEAALVERRKQKQ